MNPKVYVFNSADETVQQMAEKIYTTSTNLKEKHFHLAISGGSTPLKLFKHLRDQYASLMPWSKFKVFWVDERCVPPDNPESNYGMAHHHLFRQVDIPKNQVYRIKGEYDPRFEQERYESILRENIPLKNGLPKFDLIILGMGSDGHTASIFPDQMGLFNSEKLCEVAQNPEKEQKRITLTGKVINNADKAAFLVTGDQKAHVLKEVIEDNNPHLPASLVQPSYGRPDWYLDAPAAKFLKNIR